MRKFVKAAAVLALALALLSTSALAALTDGSVVRNADGTFTATINGAAANEQITILAVDVDNLESVADGNIFYINQKAATGESDTFANFSLKNATAGTTYHFFAGSATSSNVTDLGDVTIPVPYAIAIQGATIELGQTATISAEINPAGYTGVVTWEVVSDNSATASIAGDLYSATFSATAEGAYTVRASLENGASAEAVVTVNRKDVSVDSTVVKLVKANADEAESTADNQNGLGVALQVNTGDKAFTKMIWVFADGSDGDDARRYSEVVELEEAISGSYTFKAAFGNGTLGNGYNGDTLPSYDVVSVDAIFSDGVDTYYTNEELDAPNYEQK